MSLNLHPECRRGLAKKLAEALSNFTIQNGQFLVYESTYSLSGVDSTLPYGNIRKALGQYIGELPFFDFVRGALSSSLLRTQTYISDKSPAPLTSCEDYRDLDSLSDRLIEEFTSLPWKYALSVALPANISHFLVQRINSLALSPAVTIATPDAQFAAEYPPPPTSGNGENVASFNSLLTAMSLAVGMPPAWQTDRLYLQVRVDGFIPPFGNTAPLDDGIDQIKSFFGLGIALGLFRVEFRFGEAPDSELLSVHRRDGEHWKFERTVDLDRSVSGLLYCLEMEDIFTDDPSEDVRERALDQTLGLMGKSFSANVPLSRRLLLASQWLFDSHSGSDEMLSFVQAAVVLEILLGDKAASDLMGLGELLRNRCAYLISRNPAEREQILNDFPRIYDVRSKIVHDGKKRLNREERKLFSRLRWICQRVIRQEARLLARPPFNPFG